MTAFLSTYITLRGDVDYLAQNGDETWLHTVAKSVVDIQLTFGPFANVYCVGRCSQVLLPSSSSWQSDSYNLTSYRRCNNIVSHEFIWTRRTCDYIQLNVYY